MQPRLLATLLLVCPAVLPAQLAPQEQRTTLVVRPEGIFPQLETGTATSSPLANPNPSPTGVRWTYPNPAGMPWISERVSVGNHGTLAWLGQNLNFQRVSLLAPSDDGAPPYVIWEDLLAGSMRLEARAADKANVCAVARITNAAGPHELRYYTSRSSTPLWVANIQGDPAGSGLETAISDDGRIVVAQYTNAAGLAEIAVFDALSGTPTVPVRLLTAPAAANNGPRHLDLSGDGRVALMATHVADYQWDTGTGAQLGTASTVSVDAHSINGNGDTWGRGGFDVGAWKRNSGGGYTRVLTFRDGTLGFGIYTACDVSADGSTFTAVATDANNYLEFRVYCWQLSATGANLLWTYSRTGTGTLQDTPSAASVSDDGKWIAAGSWGTADNAHAEALLFDRDAGNVPAGSLDTPGSVFDLDLSGDGQFLVVGTKSVHANYFGNGGEGYSFDRGGQGHWLKGTPSIGRSIALETGGLPGQVVVEILGTGLGVPISLPGFGGQLLVDIGLPNVVFISGSVPGSGVHALPLTVPGTPSMINQTLFSQSLRIGGNNEFDNVVRLWITP